MHNLERSTLLTPPGAPRAGLCVGREGAPVGAHASAVAAAPAARPHAALLAGGDVVRHHVGAGAPPPRLPIVEAGGARDGMAGGWVWVCVVACRLPPPTHTPAHTSPPSSPLDPHRVSRARVSARPRSRATHCTQLPTATSSSLNSRPPIGLYAAPGGVGVAVGGRRGVGAPGNSGGSRREGGRGARREQQAAGAAHAPPHASGALACCDLASQVCSENVSSAVRPGGELLGDPLLPRHIPAPRVLWQGGCRVFEAPLCGRGRGSSSAVQGRQAGRAAGQRERQGDGRGAAGARQWDA